MARLDDDRELLRELVEIYVEEEPELLGQIREALAVGDTDAVRRSAHSLKGAVSNFAAAPARVLAEALEFAGRDGDLDRARGALAALEPELARVRDALDALLA